MTAIWEIDDREEETPGLDADGRPDPAYAARLGLVRAPFPSRAFAALIDAVLYLVVQLPLWLFAMPLVMMYLLGQVSLYGFVTHPNFVFAAVMAGATLLLSLVLGIVQLVLHGRKGVTVGKGVFGIRSVHVATLEQPGFWRVVLRGLVVLGSSLVVVGPLIMLLSPLWDPARRGRGWHDYVGRLWMVDIRRGLDPYDEKRMRIARKSAEASEIPSRPELPSLATERDPRAAADYRPGARVSAGVIGVARPLADEGSPPVGLPDTNAPAEPRPGAAPQVVLGVPNDLRGTPPERPAPRPPEPPRASEPRVEPAGAGRSRPEDSPAAEPRPVPEPSATPHEPAPEPRPAPPRPEPPEPASPAPPVPSAPTARAEPDPAPADDGAPPRPPAPPECVLVLDTGQRIRVAGTVLLGRDPQAREEVADARLISIPDDTRSISKTHLSLRVTNRGLELADLGSTNGTEIERDGQLRAVAAGSPVLAARGDTVHFGDRSFVIHLSTTDRLA